MNNFKEIKARAEAATPGPWEADYNVPFSRDFVGIYCETDGYIIKAESEDDGYSTKRADAGFIAHSREDIPALLAALEEEISRRYQAECNYDHAVADRDSAVSRAEKAETELTTGKAERDAVVKLIHGKCEYCAKRTSCHARQGPHGYCWVMHGAERRRPHDPNN